MLSAQKLSMAVPVMREPLTLWCGHFMAMHHVATHECAPSPACDAVKSHLEKMHAQLHDMCGSYDRLRHLVAELEIEQNVESPRFYADARAGICRKSHCPVLAPALKELQIGVVA